MDELPVTFTPRTPSPAVFTADGQAVTASSHTPKHPERLGGRLIDSTGQYIADASGRHIIVSSGYQSDGFNQSAVTTTVSGEIV